MNDRCPTQCAFRPIPGAPPGCSEEMFRALVENSPDVVVRYDPRGCRLYANAAWRRLSGAARDESLGRTVLDQPLMAEPEAYHRALLRAAAGTPAELRVEVDSPTVGHRIFDARVLPEQGDDGRPASVLVIGRDITEQERIARAEKHLASSRAALRRQLAFQETLLKALADVGIQQMVIERGRIVHVGNRALAHEFGFTDAALDAHPPLESILHPDDRERVLDYHRRRLAGEAVPESYELALTTRSGERREYETTVAVMPGSDPLRVITIGRDVTERKRTEHELLLLRHAVDQTSEALFVQDASLRFVSVNETACRSLGYRREELAGMTTPQIDPDFTREMGEHAFATAELGKPTRFESRHRAKDGHLFPVEITGTFFEDNGVRYAVSVARDISERKRVEQALKQREREFRTLAEHLPEPIIRYAPDGRRRYVNPAYETFFGIPAAEALGRTVADRSSLADPAGYQVNLLAAARGEDRDFDIVTDAFGSPRTYRMHLVPETDADGTVSGVLAVGHDVTGIRDVQARMARFFGNMPGFAFSFHRSARGHMRFPFVSPGIEALYGLPPEAVREDSAPLHALAHPDDRPRIESALDEAAATRSPIQFEFRIRPPNRGERWVECRSMPEPLADGGTLWHGIMLDVTDRRRIDDTLRFIADPGDGGGFLTALARHLGETLNVAYVVIDRLAEEPGIAETVALYAGGEIVPNLRYPLRGTPCDNVLGKRDCCYPRDVQALFPEDTLLVEMGVDSYAGIPLWDSTGKPLGLIAVMDAERIGDQATLLQTLRLAAPRAAAELERAESDRRLREREQAFRNLAESSPDFILRVDRERRVRYINGTMARFAGLDDPGAVIGRRLEEVRSKVRNVAVVAAENEAMASGETQRIEVALPGAAGETLQHQVIVVPERDAAGAIIGTLTFGRDVTAIREGELRLKHFIDSLPGLAYTFHLTADGRMSFPYVSQGIEALYAITAEQGMADVTAIHHRAHPDDRPRIEAAIAESARTLKPLHIESRIRRPDGTERWVDVRSVPRRLRDGSTLWYGIMLDAAERKAAEAARERALDEALRLAEARGAFLSQMSHELRTPLNGILGFAQLLQLETSLADEQRHWVDLIRGSGEHLEALIEQVLDFAKIEADKIELRHQPIELRPFIDTVAGIVRVRADQKGLAFRCVSEPAVPASIGCDPLRLRQVLINLLGNAVKFTDAGAVELRLARPAPDRLRFEVRDSGIGIPADKLGAVFEPFEQVSEPQRVSQGTGLGLAISRRLVRLMGGDIEVESRPGEGSRFTFELTLDEDLPAAPEAVVIGAPSPGPDEVPDAEPNAEPDAATDAGESGMRLPHGEELEKLLALARRGNPRAVARHAAALAEDAPHLRPFAARLAEMARGYRTKAMEEWLTHSLEEAGQ